jgi:NitT/TauT family transport system ATP-binding protein
MSSDIVIEGLSKTFAGTNGTPAFRIFENLDMHVPAGQLIALVGPSGCGKSTLLNLIAGLEKPTRGVVRFASRRPRTDLSVVFQQPRLIDWLSVEDNVSIVFDRAGMPVQDRRKATQGLLSKVGLLQHARSYPQFLSGGQQQRVAIARAFAIHPDVLLLDEPFSALDELTARRLRSLLQDMWTAGQEARPTGVLVTHNVLEAAFLADRIHVFGQQAGRFCATIDVDLPRPRDPDDPALFEIHRRVMQALN